MTRHEHPCGLSLKPDHAQGTCAGNLTLPAGVKGVFRWKGRETTLVPGGTTQIK
ncbi:MAG: hypothetical protein WCO56_17460 [Verrucomicrobiota bacterium]